MTTFLTLGLLRFTESKVTSDPNQNDMDPKHWLE